MLSTLIQKSTMILLAQLTVHGMVTTGRASPVQAEQHLTMLHGEAIDKDWLSLATVPSSSSPNIPNTVPHPHHHSIVDTSQAPHTALHSIQDIPSTSRPILPPTQRMVKGRNWDGLSEISNKNFKVQALGVLKGKYRKIWNKKFPGRSPPLQLMRQQEIKRMGMRPNGSRHHVAQYLEEEQMRKEEIEWPSMGKMSKTVVQKRFIPLAKKGKTPSGKDSDMLKAKQADVDKLLDDAGLLTTSSKEKKAAAELFVPGKRRINRSLSKVQRALHQDAAAP